MAWLFASMPGRLSSFQKTMLQWDELYPYSAVHVLQMRGALDATRLHDCIKSTLERHGLTHLVLDRERLTFRYEGGPADCEIHTLAGEGGPPSVLEAETERQLNLPFDSKRPFNPFRFLVAPAGDSFFLGVVYFHPVADGESVVCLLRDIVSAYGGGDAGPGGGSLDLYPGSRVQLLRRHPVVVARKLLSLPALFRNARQSHRPHQGEQDPLTNGFVCFSLAPEDLRSLIAAAASWGVTVNDLLMALLLKSLSPCAAARAEAGRHRKISAGCVVNLRRDQGVAGRRVFGVFLGFFAVTHEVPEGISLRQLAADVGEQTALIKRHKLCLATPLELGFARFAMRFFSPGRRKRFYGKHYPLWGGITNMNLNSLWDPNRSDAPLDYFRGVSTGPVTPLVLSVTTIGDRAKVGLSYRTSIFSRTNIADFQSRFREHLNETRRGP